MKTKRSSARLCLPAVAGVAALSIIGAIAACGDDNAVKENVAKDAGTIDGQSSLMEGGVPGSDGGLIGPDGAILDDCVANPDPNVYTDLLNACTTSFKIDPKPTIPLLFPDGGLPPLP